ncbi:hypothetical protein HYU14_02340 [Candidatus Woesearchaeota archaeon]|nr:hypothetical protein [Candidatus Woesearchaeota archaeon]
MVEYTESRSAGAIAIDGSRTARHVYSDFNQVYAGTPIKGDVEGEDTRGNKGAYLPPPKQKEEEEEEVTGEYVPTEQEKAELLPYFYHLDPMEQHKDLLVTKNVIKRKSDVGKWKQNPKYYDVRDIDTQPGELVSERLKVIMAFSGSPRVTVKKFNWSRRLGDYRHISQITTKPGEIRVQQTTKRDNTFNKVLSHELGHAYDRNIISMMASDTHRLSRRTGNTDFGNIKKPKVLQDGPSYYDNVIPLGKVNNLMLKISDMREKNRKKVIDVTEKRISPYNTKTAPPRFRMYRLSKKELFADWFSGYVANKNLVKKQTRGFYNIFKKANKPLVKALRQSDLSITRKYIGGKHAKTNWFM